MLWRNEEPSKTKEEEKKQRRQAQQVQVKFIRISYLQFFNIKKILPHDAAWWVRIHSFFRYHRSLFLRKRNSFQKSIVVVVVLWCEGAHAMENIKLVPGTKWQSSITFMQLFTVWVIASVTLSVRNFCFEELSSGCRLKNRKTEKLITTPEDYCLKMIFHTL